MTARAERAGVGATPDRVACVEARREGESADAAQHNRHVPDLFRRHPDNPLLTAADWPYAAHTVFNPGGIQLPSGETLLLVRVEDRRGLGRNRAGQAA